MLCEKMRMWNIKPELMCRQHLLGEHYEIHKMIGNLRNSGKWTKSLTSKGFLEPQNAIKRHNELVKEMNLRNYKHKSTLNVSGLKLPVGNVDVKKSIRDITQRCVECRERLR